MIIDELLAGEGSLCVVGMGYVGLPLAVAFAEKGIKVIGFDINQEKINHYANGEDPTHEVGAQRLKKQQACALRATK